MSDIVRLVEALRPEVDGVRHDIVALRRLVAVDDPIGAFFVERLQLALESTTGCILLAKDDLAYPLAILARSMLELMMSTFWAASTTERAREASGAAIAEMTRVTKSLLAKGHGKIVNKKTGEDRTAWMLDDMMKSHRRPRKQIAEMARECGLGAFYERFYPLQSMPSHGHSIGLTGDRRGDKALFAMMAGTRVYLKAVQFTVKKRIVYGQATTLAELEGFLKVGLVPPAEQS